MYVCIPACSQIWARVIQGCRGPCLGALLCREEATSDRACSTRLAAIDVAWTEPGGREWHHQTCLLRAPAYYYSSVRQPCATMQDFNPTKHNSRLHWFPRLQREEEGTMKSGVVWLQWKSLRLWAHSGTQFPVPALKPLISPQHSTRCNTQCYDPGLTRSKWISFWATMHKHCTNLHSAD